MTASLTTGRLMTKYGRYRIFPIIGTALASVSFWLFSHIAIDTSRVVLGLWMALLGLGMGMVMPVLTLAVQNAVERRNLGTATASVTFFRSIGSALGAAIFGSILGNRLAHHLINNLPAGTGQVVSESLKGSVAGLRNVSPQTAHLALVSFAQSFHDVFLFALPFAVAAFITALCLRESPLRSSTKDTANDDSLKL